MPRPSLPPGRVVPLQGLRPDHRPWRSQQLPPPTLDRHFPWASESTHFLSPAPRGSRGRGLGSGAPRARQAVRSWRGSRWALTCLLTTWESAYCICSRGPKLRLEDPPTLQQGA